MSTLVTTLLGLLAKILAEVITNVLNTPATTTTVQDVRGTLVTPPTPDDELLTRYKRLLDRG